MKKSYLIELESIQKVNIYPLIVRFENDAFSYDFSVAGDTELTRIFAYSFQMKYGAFGKDARSRSYLNTRDFLVYLKEQKITKKEELSTIHIIGYARYLDLKKEYSLYTKYRHYNNLEIIIKNIYNLSIFINSFSIPKNPFKNPHIKTKEPNKLTLTELESLIELCQQKVDYYMGNFRLGKLYIKEVTDNIILNPDLILNKKDIKHVIFYFYNKFGYLPVGNHKLSHSEQHMISNNGGIDYLCSFLHPDINILTPFYLLLLIELAGNPGPIRDIQVNCIEADPLLDKQVFIEWEKGRASKTQRRNVLKNKKYGAYQIIEFLKEITSLARDKLDEQEKQFLFVCRGEYAKKEFTKVKENAFEYNLEAFIHKNKLPFNFTLSNIRSSVLTEFYRKRKDVVAVSKIANHSSIRTTLTYIVDKETKKENQVYLSQKQSDLITKLTTPKNNTIYDSNQLAINIEFDCKKPINNDSTVCVSWMAELTNPNLIIPNNIKYISKILKLKQELESINQYMNPERFSLLYESTLNLIKNQILPQFDKQIIEEAYLLIDDIQLPKLEDY